MGEKGVVFDISHFMIEDGPGIRTCVFVKGCPLRCKWCSNAYGLDKKIQMSFDRNKCVGCQACVKVCNNNAIQWSEEGRIVQQDFSRCKRCMECVHVCMSKARKKIGYVMDAQDVVREIVRDRGFYRRGSGGVTMSGGEILLQPDFVTEVLKGCQREGIHTAIETSGYGEWTNLARIITCSDTVFMDCKCIDAKQHKRLTGVDNALILENIRDAAKLCEEKRIRLIIRFPLIPTMNDDRKNIESTAAFVKSLEGSSLLNVLPYHNYGASKYQFLGSSYETEELPTQGKEEMGRVREILTKAGVDYSIGGYDIEF